MEASRMNGTQYKSKNWLIFLVSVIAISLVAVLGLLIWNSQAATPEPRPAGAFVQLNPTTGEAGTIVTISGNGWQPGETVLVYLVETASGSTDGVVYASTVAGLKGEITASLRYPQSGPWSGKQEAIVSVWGATSGRTARAAFQVIQPTAEPTVEPNTPTSQPTNTPTPEPTNSPEPDTPVPATNTPEPVPPTPTVTPVLPTATPLPPAPTSTPIRITEWRGEYYNNVNLTGAPRVRNDKKVDFDWGYGSPTKGINADSFSVRWTRRLDFEAKTYRFNVRADDGVRLWVDGQLLIDQWHDGSTRTYSAERTMTQGKHDVRVEMYERSGLAIVAFWREPVESYPDWKGEYFNNTALSGAPLLIRNDKGIDFTWGEGAPAPGLPADNFGVRWTRQLHYPAGNHRFTVEVDDGVRVWVDGILIINQWHDGIGSHSGDIYLADGTHTVRMEMYEHTGGAMARLWWARQEGFPEWKGEYFANPNLQGKPVLVRNDANIDFNWAAGAPAAGLPADNFGVRWTRQLRYSAGHYRFTVEVDDGARLWVDGILIINQWHDGIGSYSGDIYLAEGTHTVRMEMYERTGGTMARLRWARQEGFPEWKGEYFANRKLQGAPALVRNDPSVDFNWGAGAPAAGLPADGFSVRWTRKLEFQEGLYRFHVQVDDGARLWVDDQLVVDQWHEGTGTYSGDRRLSQGKHTIRMEMFEHTGGAMARLWWAVQPEFPQWKGWYYSNTDLLGDPVLVRNDKEINFRWGKDAPAAGLPIDGFGVRWTRNVDFEPGVYRFCATADDGVRVSIDSGIPFIDEWHDSSGSTYCKDVRLAQGRHKIKVEYYDNLERAMIKLWWDRLADG
jgi:RNase P/RNase MRP subunit p29